MQGIWPYDTHPPLAPFQLTIDSLGYPFGKLRVTKKSDFLAFLLRKTELLWFLFMPKLVP